jgi:hypothetical protein
VAKLVGAALVVEEAADGDRVAGATGDGKGSSDGEVGGVDGHRAARQRVGNLGRGRQADAGLPHAPELGPLEADALLVQMKAWSQHDLGK